MALYGSDVAVDRVNMQLKKIFEPITINKTEFKNRMVVSAMVTNYCNEDGTPTEKFMAYHEHKAKGGYGIIITEDFAVTRTAVRLRIGFTRQVQ